MRKQRMVPLAPVFLALLAAACVPSGSTKTAGEHLDDGIVTARVKSALAADMSTGDSLRTDVETFRGGVQLNGFVDSAEKKAEAARIASAVEGVTSVENNLRVATAGRSFGEAIDDHVLTASVKAALAADPKVAAHDVNIATRRGVVQLAGFVDTMAERTRAGELARGVSGVESVDNQLQVKKY